MNKLIAASAAVLLGGGAFLGIAAPAFADDDPTVVEVVETPAVVEEAPVAAPEPAPEPIVEEVQPLVVEPASEPEAVVEEAPVETARVANVKLPICHSGSGAHWSYIAPDANGYNGHQHHDLDVYGLTEAECLAKNPPVVDDPPVTVSYHVVAWSTGAAPPHHFDVPQTTQTDGSWSVKVKDKDLTAMDGFLADREAALACSSSEDWQIDGYIDDATTDTLIAGGILYGPSNPTEHLWGGYEGTAWKFVHLTNDAPCLPNVIIPQVVPQPATCDTDGSFDFLSWTAGEAANSYLGDGFIVTLDKSFTGGGTYTLTFTGLPAGSTGYPDGSTVSGLIQQIIQVPFATGYQSENPDAPCYVTPPPVIPKVVVPEIEVLPATCTTDGGFDLSIWQAGGKNIFVGDGYVVHLSKDYPDTGWFDIWFEGLPAGLDSVGYPNGSTVTGDLIQSVFIDTALGYQSTDSEAPCYKAPPTHTPVPVPPALALTGSNGNVFIFVGIFALALMILGVIVMYLERRRRRTNV